jgi:uncharacterized protein
MKLLIIIIILYLAYRAFKYWMLTTIIPGPKVSTGSERQIDDIMVKDPVCEVYFPKKSGVSLSIEGKTLYFCSEECKDKYLSKKAK